MIKKILKWATFVVGTLVLIAGVFYLKVYFSTESRMNKTYDWIIPQPITLTNDSAMLAHGSRLVTTKGCTDCHGADLGGKVFINDPGLGLLAAANLTKGEGGLPEDYSASDWVLALKHGIDRNKKPLLFMPSHEFTLLSEYDMSALITYCAQLTPIDRTLPQNKLGPVGRILTDLNKLPMFPVEMIDHDRTLVKYVKEEVTTDFGKYLSVACQGCHRENMKGGDPVAPGFPPVADITSTGNPGKWTEQQFMETLRTGITPEGKKLKPEEMPWTMTKAYTDTELKALYAYVRSL